MKLVILLLLGVFAFSANAVCPNSCSGHGTCNAFDQCTCYDEGKTVYFGAEFDVTVQDAADVSAGTRTAKSKNKQANVMKQWTGADCSLMTCPRGMSWNSLDVSYGCATHEDFAECSDKGLCDRTTGQCQCFEGYTGPACQRTKCQNDCNGHGICQSNLKFATDASAHYTNAWDSGRHYGCKCDTGFRGPDCSLRECPSKSDPLSFKGNDNGRDCSGRGLCNYATGQCECFSGYTGFDCGQVQALA